MRERVGCVIAVVDIEGFSRRTDPVQRSLRSAMYEVLRSAAQDTHLAWTDLRPEDRGDGVLMPIADHVSPVVVAGAFVEAINAALAEKATMYSEIHRMRFRMALHHGLVDRDAEGWSGDAVNTACRLVDAQPLRDTLAAAGRAHSAVIVSDNFYRFVVQPGHRSIDPSTFVPVSITSKNLDDYPAWVRVPGYSSPPSLHGRAATRTYARPAEHGFVEPPRAGIVITGNVAGDAVAGDKHEYRRR